MGLNRSGRASVWLFVFAAVLAGVMHQANAAVTINSMTLNGTAAVTVPPNATIAASGNATSDTTLRSYGYRIATTPPGALTCVNTPNHLSGTFTDPFSITAPAAAGTYNAYFVAYAGNNCTGAASATFTLTNAVVVAITNAANSTVVASPTSVLADGTTASTVTVTLKDASNVAVPSMTVTLTAGSGSSTITPASGVSNASGVVSFTVKDAVAEAVTYTAQDITGGVTITQTATVTYSRLTAPTATKTFSPTTVVTSAASTLSITLTNPNTAAIGALAFTDTYPVGLVNTATPSLTNSCGGTATAAAGGSTLSLTGGSIPGSTSCTVTVQVTSAGVGVYLNSTGTVTSANANTGAASSATLTVNVAGPTVSSFNVVEPGAGAVTGKIFTKTAGQNFSLDIVALDASNAVATGFTGTVAVQVVDNSSGGACASLPTIASFTNQIFAAGDAGRHALTAPNTVADVYRNARIRVQYPTASPTVTSCSGDNFAIRPATITVTASDANRTTEGTLNTLNNTAIAGTTVHNAGRPFRITATAANGAATPAVTVNYDGTLTTVLSACAGTACTASFGNLTAGTWTASSGVLTTTTASYDDVGAFTLQLQDTTFTSVDSADGTPSSQLTISSTVTDVGRFVPDHFVLSGASLTPRSDIGACSASTFTYMGERMDAVFTLTAANAAGATTSRYNGTLARLDLTTPASFSFGAIDSAVPTPLTTRVDTSLGTSGSWANGVANVTGIVFLRRNAAPDGPYGSFKLGVAPSDPDSVTLAASALNLDADNSGSNERQLIATTAIRFGRLRLQNANGSQLIAMPLPLTAQYWNGSGFVTNTLDNCTSISASNIALGSYQGNLGAGQTTPTVGGAFSAGVGSLRLSPPGTSRNGSVDVSLNLTGGTAGASCTTGMPASTGGNKTYLQGAWCGTSYANDPTARATFGTYRNSDKFIYQRENF